MGIEIKLFESYMNEGLKALELTSNNEIYFCGLLVVGRNFKVDYNNIIEYKFGSPKNGFILVAEKTEENNE